MDGFDRTVLGMLGGLGLFALLLIGLIFWSSQDFADRCERAGGVLVKYSVCLTPDSHVLMVQ